MSPRMKILIYYALSGCVFVCDVVFVVNAWGGQMNVQSSGQVAGVIPYIMSNNKMPEQVFRLAFTDLVKLTISMLAH